MNQQIVINVINIINALLLESYYSPDRNKAGGFLNARLSYAYNRETYGVVQHLITAAPLTMPRSL